MAFTQVTSPSPAKPPAPPPQVPRSPVSHNSAASNAAAASEVAMGLRRKLKASGSEEQDLGAVGLVGERTQTLGKAWENSRNSW